MKQIRLFLSMVLMAVLPMNVLADCAFTDSIFPGQPKGREQRHIAATIPVGTIVDNITADLVEYKSSDSAVVLPYMSSPSKFFALKPGVAAITYKERTEEPGQDPCITDHSIMYTVVKGDPEACFMRQSMRMPEYNYEWGDEVDPISAVFKIPTVFIDGGVPKKLNKTVPLSEIQFKSSDGSVAIINASGYLTIVGGGSTLITAYWPGNDEWNAAQTTITVNVEMQPIRLKVAGIKVTRDNCKDIIGDGKKQAVYDPAQHLLTLKNVNWDFSNHNIDAKYGVVEYWDPEEDLYIEIHGKCTFTNTTMGINTEVHNGRSNTSSTYVDITGVNGGSLTMSGSDTQIRCGQGVAVDELQLMVSASGRMEKAVQSGGFNVFGASNVVVTSTGEGGLAINTKNVYLDEGVSLGEGINFVPYEVSQTLYGFYANGQKAKTVSILSQTVTSYGDPEVPSDEAATDVNLSGTTTSGKEDVAMIVLGEEDKYNTAQGQLEIYSVLSEEVVKDAINLFGAGSEALKSALPGSISFFIPAGSGSIQLEFCTTNGYVNVQLENEEAKALTNELMNWTSVWYNVTKNTYVVIYLAPSVKQSVPAYIAAAKMDAPVISAFIKGIKIDPTDETPTGIESQELKANSQKMIKDGQLIILRGEKTYTVTGQEIK